MEYCCKFCHRVWKVCAKSEKGLTCCPDCSGELVEYKSINGHKAAIVNSLKFTPKERKQIWADWKTSIQTIPTADALAQREKRAKRAHQTFQTANI